MSTQKRYQRKQVILGNARIQREERKAAEAAQAQRDAERRAKEEEKVKSASAPWKIVLNEWLYRLTTLLFVVVVFAIVNFVHFNNPEIIANIMESLREFFSDLF